VAEALEVAQGVLPCGPDGGREFDSVVFLRNAYA
jgi:hypothetical protein